MDKVTTIEKITKFAARKPWQVIAAWAAITIVATFFTVTQLSSALTTSQDFTNLPESEIADQLIKEHFPEQATNSEFIVIHSNQSNVVTESSFREFASQLIAEIRSENNVERVVSFFEQPNPALVSTSQDALLIPVFLKGDFPEQERSVITLIEKVREKRTAEFNVRLTGPAAISANFSELSEQDLKRGEIFGLPIALIILFVVFGAVAAAFLPLFLGLLAIANAIGLTALLGSQFEPFSFFVVNMITMMGLAVGIDYSLFVVSRFREERQQGADKETAVITSGTTAGRAVLFSGLTVILALLGLFFVPMNIFQGLASGAIFVVAFAVLATLTLLPAVLILLGDRINYGRVRKEQAVADIRGGFWDRLVASIMKRPVVSLVLAVVFMLLLAFPALDLRIGVSGINTMPEHLEARQAYDLLKKDFGVGLVSPATLVLKGNTAAADTQESIKRFHREIGTRVEFGPAVVSPSDNGEVVAIRFPMNVDTASLQSENLVKELRSGIIPNTFGSAPIEPYLGGEAARQYDFINIARSSTPGVFVFVLGLSFLLLLVVFRSIIVPIKALLMNLLSVASAYGLLVLVFQKGVGNELFGFRQVERIEAWLPLFLFCILFGLSMDYHVFLLSRIRERFFKTRDNSESVAFGVRSTAKLITGAALIMVAVFGAFASGDLVILQQMGFGLAVAILLDATIVRSFLVPASMQLLGERNWYLPSWLHWLPNLSLEGKARNTRKSN